MRRPVVLALSTLLAAAVFAGASTAPASAHAIIELNGVSAVAGTSSLMTLEIQHGCLPSEATTQVEAFVGKPWRGLRPSEVDGWTSTVDRLASGGLHIVWTRHGDPIPFGTAAFLPITVEWPTKPGVYAMHVTQQCTNGQTYDWNTKYQPATANSPSPPLTPRPEVQVVAKAEPPSAAPKASASAHVDAHAH